MPRFGRLEFDGPESRHDPGPEHEVEHKVGQDQELSLAADGDRDERYWCRLAVDERRNGLFESALRHYSRALEVDRSVVAAWAGQVQMLIALGEYPEAELWARKALELFKANADLLAARAQALCRTGDLGGAQATCDAALGQPGQSAAPWVARGELMLARRQDLDGYCFDKAVQADDDWLVPLEVGAIYLHYGRPAKALARTRQALEKAPDHAYCWYRQGACELELGLTGPAERSFKRCLQLVPGHADAARALVDLDNDRRPVRRFLKRLLRRGLA